MNLYQDLARKLNARLQEFKPIPKAEVRKLRYKGDDYPFVAFENPQNHMGIALSYNEEEWTVEFLGTHCHVPDMEDIDEYLLMTYILPVFADILVVVAMPDGTRVCADVQKVKEAEFKKSELWDDPDIIVLCWSGQLDPDIALRCKAYARRILRGM